MLLSSWFASDASFAQLPDRHDATISSAEPERVRQVLENAAHRGNAARGLQVFGADQFACIACHQIGKVGGSVGPKLTAVAPQRTPEQLVEAILQPQANVLPEYVAHRVVTTSGSSWQGYLQSRSPGLLVLRDPTTGELQMIPSEEIDSSQVVGSLMPDGIAQAMSEQQLADVVRLLLDLRQPGDVAPLEAELRQIRGHTHGLAQGPANFDFARGPISPAAWPAWAQPVNRDRLYDFYTKQARHFRDQRSRSTDAELIATSQADWLTEFPGLDGGAFGHWGNQNEAYWADGRWNLTDLGSLQCGVFRDGDLTVPRGICFRLTTRDNVAVCFDPDRMEYVAAWDGGFVRYSDVRHGFMDGLRAVGNRLQQLIPTRDELQDELPPALANTKVASEYRGIYRFGDKTVFSFQQDGREYFDSLDYRNGQWKREIALADQHSLRSVREGGPAQWPVVIETAVRFGTQSPYAIDTIELPFDNPWKALLFVGGHAFLPDGSALVCTIQGDVWRVSDFSFPSTTARWRRFASGLHQPLGIVIDRDGIFVLGRDQITRLHDLNKDGEADFYEAFSRSYQTSPAGHDFICGLERDAAGHFYTASGNQGVLQISPDGKHAKVIATGFRNPDGLGVLPDGTVTIPSSEGDWVPATLVGIVQCHDGVTDVGSEAGELLGKPKPSTQITGNPLRRRLGKSEAGSAQSDGVNRPPHFGYGGPKNDRLPDLPLLYLPRGLDNSAGSQAYVSSQTWGPLHGQLLHLSFGTATHQLILRDQIDGQWQGAAVPLSGEFASGAHRGRFHPLDGQLYVSGMQGWGTYAIADGALQRVRYTGVPVQLPIAFRAHENGMWVKFSRAVDAALASNPAHHFAQGWNYRYSAAYGSAEYSTRHFGTRGHDVFEIKAVHVLPDQQSVFFEIPSLQPLNTLHLLMKVDAGIEREMFATIHALAPPFQDFPGYQPLAKTVSPHPLEADVLLATKRVPNPWIAELKDARSIELHTASNLSFATRTLRARAGEQLSLTLTNPDVVPHNWVLVKPDTLQRVGELTNRLIADPAAAAGQYVPETTDVLAFTDIVPSGESFTIYFTAPRERGRYPFLCTFPGHWAVMNGELVVE